MIKIVKQTAPIELTNLKNKLVIRGLTPEQEYSKLKNPLKSTVREQLMKEQGHICAYCMREIPDVRVKGTSIPEVTLEHWIARNSKDNTLITGSGMGVEYENLLAVCSGGKMQRGTYSDNELTCDANRGNEPITVNPLNESTLETIYYKNNGEIAAKNPIINNDIVNILNLNCEKYSSLPAGRKSALQPIETQVALFSEPEDIMNECKSILSDFESETDPKTPYCGYIIWWLKDYINALEV